MPCLHEPCPNEATWRPILKLRSRQNGPATALRFTEITLCEQHRQSGEVADFLSPEGFDKLARILREAGKPVPTRRLTTLAWEPMTPSLVLGMGKEAAFAEAGTAEKLKNAEIPVVIQYAKLPEVILKQGVTAMTRKKKAAPAKIATVRREYLTAKRLYHKIGKKAFGKPGRSGVQRDYCAIKREYRQLGQRLASLTGRKPRHK
jgi:hypothetical protein